MKSRLLPIINAAGCLIITGLVVFQWIGERHLDHQILKLRSELSDARGQYAQEAKKTADLERDVAQLKESIESAQQARTQEQEEIARARTEQESQTTGLTTAFQEQTKIWEKAIADRDERIRTLNTSLTATRARLDEAVAELKKAATDRR